MNDKQRNYLKRKASIFEELEKRMRLIHNCWCNWCSQGIGGCPAWKDQRDALAQARKNVKEKSEEIVTMLDGSRKMVPLKDLIGEAR